MKRTRWLASLMLAGLALAPTAARARGLAVEVWTDRGDEAVYQPGDVMQLRARASRDAYLLVYEIDSEGYVHVLFPYQGKNALVEGRETYRIPDQHSDVELTVERHTGEGYIVAIASAEPFEDLPWYLRPYNAQGEDVGYVNRPEDDQGVTGEGRIVGDPFVAMERIRRLVLHDAKDPDAFATAYTTYYVHQQVRYPRYICYDCHRPNYWAWWDGFDPYYAHCSVIDFRINWSWGWGPGYWFGCVPYYVYVYRPDCPPRYRHGIDGVWYSSWDGWNRWCDLWGFGSTRRYKSPPPPGYLPPRRFYDNWKAGGAPPPGFLVANTARGRFGAPATLPVGRSREASSERDGSSLGGRRPQLSREPVRGVREDEDRSLGRGGTAEHPRPEVRRMPSRPAEPESPRAEHKREQRREPPRAESPRAEGSSRAEHKREERREPPRVESPRDEGSSRGGRAQARDDASRDGSRHSGRGRP